MKQLLDTNVILYFLAGKLCFPLPDNKVYFISVITEIELLSFPTLDTQSELNIKAFLEEVEIINLTPEIVKATIEIRKKYNTKLPDSIVLASAKTMDLELLSNDAKFAKVTEVRCQGLPILDTGNKTFSQ